MRTANVFIVPFEVICKPLLENLWGIVLSLNDSSGFFRMEQLSGTKNKITLIKNFFSIL
jgi:hypothetical protein